MKLRQLQSRLRGRQAFTMVEIAISLAVVAFALVAIVGVLPAGLQVQKDNREETIANADGNYLLETLRTGNDRFNLLSNAVYFVQVQYKDGAIDTIANENAQLDGQRLLGLIGTPRNRTLAGVSNVVFWMHSLNGTAIDRDPLARDLAFRYQVVAEIQPFLAFPPTTTNLLSTNELARIERLQDNLHEVRLSFRWPLFNDNPANFKNARVGTHRRHFRALFGGSQTFYPTNILGREHLVYYFHPTTVY